MPSEVYSNQTSMTKRQKKSLELLEEYFRETPAEEIQAGIDAVSKIKSSGSTVKEYFDNFHLAFVYPFAKEEYYQEQTDSVKNDKEHTMKQKIAAPKNSKEQKLLAEVKHLVQREDPSAQVYLFGSRARQDYRPDSDWDFFVVTSREDYRRFEDKILDVSYDLMLKYGELFQIIAYPKSSWEAGRSPSPLYDNIRKEGIVL